MPTCELYSLFTLKPALQVWKIGYCTADYSKCARYVKACEGKVLLPTLLPNGKHLKLVR